MPGQILVARLRHDQIRLATELLARAFHDQPYGIFYEPDSERRLRLLQEEFSRLVQYCLSVGEP